MPSAPNTDDNGTDQPDTDPSSQPGDAASSDEVPSSSDAGEVEGDPDRDATEADQAAADTSGSEREDEPFPARGVLTLRALRWGGLLGGVVLAATAPALHRGLVGARSLIPGKVSALTICVIVGGALVWPFLNFWE